MSGTCLDLESVDASAGQIHVCRVAVCAQRVEGRMIMCNVEKQRQPQVLVFSFDWRDASTGKKFGWRDRA